MSTGVRFSPFFNERKMGKQTLSTEGLKLLTRLEGNVLTAYRCEAGVLTIGVGHTGADVTEGMVITEEESLTLLKKDVVKFERAVNKYFSVTIPQNKFDALVIFSFNVGIGNFSNSTLLRVINSNFNSPAVVNEFKRWVYVTNSSGEKVKSNGLVKRQNATSCLWYSGNYTKWV